jgi:hypothetical protein
MTIGEKIKQSVVFWLARRLPNCKDVSLVMSQSLDRKLSWRESIEMKLHAAICVWCKRYLEQLHWMRSSVRSKRSGDEQPASVAAGGLNSEAKERMKRLLNQKGP